MQVDARFTIKVTINSTKCTIQFTIKITQFTMKFSKFTIGAKLTVNVLEGMTIPPDLFRRNSGAKQILLIFEMGCT